MHAGRCEGGERGPARVEPCRVTNPHRFTELAWACVESARAFEAPYILGPALFVVTEIGDMRRLMAFSFGALKFLVRVRGRHQKALRFGVEKTQLVARVQRLCGIRVFSCIFRRSAIIQEGLEVPPNSGHVDFEGALAQTRSMRGLRVTSVPSSWMAKLADAEVLARKLQGEDMHAVSERASE